MRFATKAPNVKPVGYSNPLQGLQRRMAANFAEREFSDPALARTRAATGLGSLRRTMPHLRRSVRMASGGLDPVGEAYASRNPNLYNPNDFQRRIMNIQKSLAKTRNPDLLAMPFSNVGLAGGGPSPDDLMVPEENLSPGDQDMRQIVIEALAALEGQHPDPQEAITQFVETFGRAALRDLQLMAERMHAQGGDEEEDDEEEEEGEEEPEPDIDELEAAGGGLLRGPGTGQSDEIEATTPSGRPVLLSDGEYVIDAPTVAALGDGSTSAGARRLDDLRRQIRRDAYGHDRQAKPMRKGGIRIGK